MAGIRGFTGWIGTILGTPDPAGLGRFYQGLLGGELDEGDPTFVTLLVRPTDTTNLGLPARARPRAADLAGARPRRTSRCRCTSTSASPRSPRPWRTPSRWVATVADFQPQDDVRVMLDPAGHPFCLYLDRG